jgi:hypothetical protein
MVTGNRFKIMCFNHPCFLYSTMNLKHETVKRNAIHI